MSLASGRCAYQLSPLCVAACAGGGGAPTEAGPGAAVAGGGGSSRLDIQPRSGYQYRGAWRTVLA
eukprot:6190984-Pleurochrysis_carterae.AAC.3